MGPVVPASRGRNYKILEADHPQIRLPGSLQLFVA
jgi:hypothetical protein